MGFNSGFKGLKCFELKIILVINLRKRIVYFSFYFNLKIVRFFFAGPCIMHCPMNVKLLAVSKRQRLPKCTRVVSLLPVCPGLYIYRQDSLSLRQAELMIWMTRARTKTLWTYSSVMAHTHTHTHTLVDRGPVTGPNTKHSSHEFPFYRDSQFTKPASSTWRATELSNIQNNNFTTYFIHGCGKCRLSP